MIRAATRLCTLAVAFALMSSAAAAQENDVSGYDALMLAHIVGMQDQSLSYSAKRALDGVALGAWSADRAARASLPPIAVQARSVLCRASNVAINSFSCTLRFDEEGLRIAELTGRVARELFVVLRAQGVGLEGGAGSIVAEIAHLSCEVDVAEAADAAGGGAHCTYERISGEPRALVTP